MQGKPSLPPPKVPSHGNVQGNTQEEIRKDLQEQLDEVLGNPECIRSFQPELYLMVKFDSLVPGVSGMIFVTSQSKSQKNLNRPGRSAIPVVILPEFPSSEDSRNQPLRRAAIADVFVAERVSEGFLFNTNPVQVCCSDWENNHYEADNVREAQSQSKKREDAASVCRMTNKAIDTFADDPMIFRDRYIYRELAFQ